MTTKEQLFQEIESMSEVQRLHLLDIVRDLKGDRPKPPHRKGSGKSILRHAGKWVGDDLKDCLQAVYDSRGLAEF